ncbi:MAG: 3-dehydroquinate synthase [bacterium]|jgi:3-dehydroquinate synthase
MNKIRVDLNLVNKDNGYDILIDSGIISGGQNKETAAVLSSADLNLKGRILVITSETVKGLYGGAISSFLKNYGVDDFAVMALPDGEATKSLKYLSDIYDRLVEIRLERSDFIIAFGGGVVGDISGFAAATYLRGINFIQIPTTLLADVDSSVGGKTGIDHPEGKNLIGAFYQPKAVIIDVDLLKTLDKRELANGFAEVIKYGAALDAEFFAYLEAGYGKVLSYDKEALTYIIKRSCSIKAKVVKEDEKEAGLRSVLNFGHSLGHAVETLYNYENIKHGEAVAIGMVFAAALSKHLGLCSEDTVKRVKNLIVNSGLPADIPQFTPEQYINAMKLDKKVSEKQIKFVLISEIGRYEFRKLDFDFILGFLNRYENKKRG